MAEELEPRFAKRRKIASRRPKGASDVSEEERLDRLDTFKTHEPRISSSNGDKDAPGTGTVSDEELRLGEVKMMLQKRKAARSRISMVPLSDLNGTTMQDTRATQEQDVSGTKAVEANALTQAVSDRFAPQTGLYSNRDDVHMAAFVDSEMTKIKNSSVSNLNSPASNADTNTRLSTEQRALRAEREAAAMGLLREVNIEPKIPNGEGSNLQETLQVRELAQNQGPRALSNSDRLPKWRLKRMQKKDQDIKRDRMVEDFLSENKLDMYGNSEDKGIVGVGNDEAADTMMAEKFEQDFLEAASLRNDARPKPPSKVTGKKNKPAEEKPRGPKLGGSRSARAAMHAQGKGQQVRK